jgi:ABC-type uncharacterized transport system substrate-binding protein
MKVFSRQGAEITKTVCCVALSIVLFAFSVSAHAQPAAKVARIGIVRGYSADPGRSMKILRDALQELGYVEGKNIIFELRYDEGNRERVPGIVAELVNLKVDVIFSTQAIVIRDAKQATKSIPIVMATTVDPIAAGLVDSLARPGGNVTGLTSLARELSGKRLELLTEMIPRLSRVAILSAPRYGASKDYEEAARALKVMVQALEVQEPSADLPKIFQAAAKDGVGALITTNIPPLGGRQKQLADLAIQNRLPLMTENLAIVDAGGLVFYGAKTEEIFKRSAVYIDKILKGVKPADLPVEQPTKFELVINLKTAKQIGVMIPPNVLARADRVIR